LYGGLQGYTQFVDKFEVRDFVEKTIGEEYLIPLVGVWPSPGDVPFAKLPDQYVLKATHGSGYSFICRDKALVDKEKLLETAQEWVKENFYERTRETQCKSCKPKIICEEYIEDKSGELTDYRFFLLRRKAACSSSGF
jgi:hypothetical protein